MKVAIVVLNYKGWRDTKKCITALFEQTYKNFEIYLIDNGSGDESVKELKKLKARSIDENKPIKELIQGIITDVEMPVLDGLTLCRMIKEDPVLKELPVAIFSSLINENLRHKGESVGANAQFAKPELRGLSDKMREMIMGK